MARFPRVDHPSITGFTGSDPSDVNNLALPAALERRSLFLKLKSRFIHEDIRINWQNVYSILRKKCKLECYGWSYGILTRSTKCFEFYGSHAKWVPAKLLLTPFVDLVALKNIQNTIGRYNSVNCRSLIEIDIRVQDPLNMESLLTEEEVAIRRVKMQYPSLTCTYLLEQGRCKRVLPGTCL